MGKFTRRITLNITEQLHQELRRSFRFRDLIGDINIETDSCALVLLHILAAWEEATTDTIYLQSVKEAKKDDIS